MPNTNHDPVDSLNTEKADSSFRFPTSAKDDPPEGPTQPSATARNGDFREASQSWDTKSSGNDARAGVKDKLSDMQDALVRNYRVATDTTDDFVHDNPWKAIIMAALGGVIVGMLVSR
jgi:ElaB/YqjD/DUF883 family membrane-anchored ribosome-binding protein